RGQARRALTGDAFQRREPRPDVVEHVDDLLLLVGSDIRGAREDCAHLLEADWSLPIDGLVHRAATSLETGAQTTGALGPARRHEREGSRWYGGCSCKACTTRPCAGRGGWAPLGVPSNAARRSRHSAGA